MEKEKIIDGYILLQKINQLEKISDQSCGLKILCHGPAYSSYEMKTNPDVRDFLLKEIKKLAKKEKELLEKELEEL